jgi:2-keto-4-pentenoate hydratase
VSAVDAVAASLIRAWRDGQRQPWPAQALANDAEAYAVQRRVAEALGWFDTPGRNAWKLGGAPGGRISAARVPSAALHAAGWEAPPGYCFDHGIEGELIVRLSRDLDEACDLATATAAIDAWMPGIELCDSRWLDVDQAAPLLRLADQQLNRALILGAPRRLDTLPDWRQQRAELRVDGQSVVSGHGSHPFGDPLSSLPWLARHAAGQGQPLRAGDLIATGSWTGLRWVRAGVSVEVNFPGLGSAGLLIGLTSCQ